jgi:hypothetical protein
MTANHSCTFPFGRNCALTAARPPLYGELLVTRSKRIFGLLDAVVMMSRFSEQGEAGEPTHAWLF